MKTADNILQLIADGDFLKANQGIVDFDTGTSTWTLRCDFESLDNVGGRFRSIRLERHSGEITQPLDVRASVSANRLTGMLESIKLVEVDHVTRIAQLRSSAPLIRGTVRQYYELKIYDAQTITLERFQFDSVVGKRESILFTLTYDALAKLVNDLTSD